MYQLTLTVLLYIYFVLASLCLPNIFKKLQRYTISSFEIFTLVVNDMQFKTKYHLTYLEILPRLIKQSQNISGCMIDRFLSTNVIACQTK